MAVVNAFLNAQEYANSMLLLVKNYLRMGGLVSKTFLPDVSDENGLKIYVKRPPRFVQGSGPTFQPQNMVTGSTSVEVTQYNKVHLSIGDLATVQSFNQLMKSQTMLSVASTLAQGVDSFLHTKLRDFNNWVNAPAAAGATDLALATPQQFIPVTTRLGNLGVPEQNIGAVFSLEDNAGVAGSLIDKYMTDVALQALKRGEIPMLSDVKSYKTQNVGVLVTGTRTSSGAAQVDGATQNSRYALVKDTMTQTLAVKGLTNGHTIKKGEVFTIAGVFAVNPRQISADGTNIRTLTHLQQFTVVNDVTVSGTTANVTISPPIITPNTGVDQEDQWVNTAFATVSATPADSAAITWAGAPSTQFTVRAAWAPQAIQLVGAQLIKPFNGECAFATDPESGLSIRYWRGSDFNAATHGHRWDMIYGATTVDPLLGTRFSGL